MAKTLLTKREPIDCEQQAKFIQKRIISTEINFGELCNVLAEYTRKAGRLRDKSDEVAKIVMTFAESEDVNKTLSDALANLAYCFSILGDYGDLRVHGIEHKVISEMSQYESLCKAAREEVKHIFNVRDREIARKRQLDRFRERNPRNRQQITQAETELVKASTEVTKRIHELEEQTNAFEKRKLHDIKNALLEFIKIEIAFHAKALESFTKSYQEINEIDEESDLKEFRNKLRHPETIPHTTGKRSVFRNSQSLGSLNNLQTSPNKQQNSKFRRAENSEYVSKSTESLESINIDNLASAESIVDSVSDSELSSASQVAKKFLAKKHRQQQRKNVL